MFTFISGTKFISKQKTTIQWKKNLLIVKTQWYGKKNSFHAVNFNFWTLLMNASYDTSTLDDDLT